MVLKFLCDFDGTIALNDLTLLTLQYFASPGWEIYDKDFLNGTLSLEECLKQQIGMISADRTTILKTIRPYMHMREGFPKLVEFCKINEYEIWVVSAGIDFIIQDFMKLNNIANIQIYCPRTEFKNGRNELCFPEKQNQIAINFKDDFALHQRNDHSFIISIGDGESDYSLSERSDLTFAVMDSKLSNYCKKKCINHYEFSSFLSIIKIISKEIIQ